jgi:predicted dinucleotide-binding enzyme
MEEQNAPTMFICGNKRAAKTTVTTLLAEMGWHDVVDMGSIEMSRNIEPLSILWYAYGFRTGTWNHAFKLIVK